MRHTLAISLSPNVFAKDVFLALGTLLAPWSYIDVNASKSLEKWFQQYFSVPYTFSYTSGRAALYEILSAYNIGKGDEVITQAFTCVALPNAIIAVGATPIYVDVSRNLTMDPSDVEKKITQKTKAIIMQHTFGIPSDIEKILKIAKQHNIPVIEDCAHGIGVSYKGKKLGEFGDVAFFSFGRDKAFSSVFGGMTITQNKDLADKLQAAYGHITYPSYIWTAQQLFHPVIFSLILPLYDVFSLGKLFLVVFQKLHLLSFPVSVQEKKGVYKKSEVKRLPGALAKLAHFQLKRVSLFNKKREEIADMYIHALGSNKSIPSTEKLPYLRFPFLSEKRDEIILSLRKKKIYIGKWYANVIDPLGTDFAAIQYTKGSCPHAEYVAERILNLPTFPRMSSDDAKQIISFVKPYA